MKWSEISVSKDGTHHVVNGVPLYAARFEQVLKFHEPGLAPVSLNGLAWHIKLDGTDAYQERFRRTFGFYEGLAAVVSDDGWYHINPEGIPLYAERYAWCGNFQNGLCTVRTYEDRHFHLRTDGSKAYEGSWRYAGDFRDGIAVVQGDDGLSTHIDSSGQLLHDRWFLDLDVFHKGFARARDQFGWMHVDPQGIPAYWRRYASVEPFYNGQSRVERVDGGLEVIDETGRVIVELRPTPMMPRVEGEILARTAWGRVQLVSHDGKPSHVSKWTRGSNDREVDVLLTLRGTPGVPALLARSRCDMNDQLLLSYCPGKAVGDPRSLTVYPESESIRVLIDILNVCSVMHDSGWVHSDIHPGNVLTGNPATLLDFACAVRSSYDHPWRGEINWGVWEYVPPEMLCDYGEISPAADVYSSAALSIAMLTGSKPFSVQVGKVYSSGGWPAVRHAFLDERAKSGAWAIRESLLSVLAPALAVNPADRPTARQLSMELGNV